MGPVTALNDIFLVTFDALYLGQQIITTLAYRCKAVGSPTSDLTETYEFLRTHLDTLGNVSECYADLYTTDVTSIKLHIQKIYPTRWLKETAFSAHPAGTRAAANPKLPASGAAALTLRSIAAEAAGRGTKHILATDQSDVGSGEIGEEFRGLLQDFGDICVTEAEFGPVGNNMVMAPIIYHREAPIASQQVDWATIQPHSRIMRRRTVGQGS